MTNLMRRITDKLDSKYRNFKYKENEYYEFHYPENFDPVKNMIGVKLLKGPYAGVAYTYDTFFIKEENPDGSALGTFDVTIHESGPLLNSDKNNLPKKLNTIIADIFLCVLENSIAMMKSEDKKAESETDDVELLEEPTPKRTRRKKTEV